MDTARWMMTIFGAYIFWRTGETTIQYYHLRVMRDLSRDGTHIADSKSRGTGYKNSVCATDFVTVAP